MYALAFIDGVVLAVGIWLVGRALGAREPRSSARRRSLPLDRRLLVLGMIVGFATNIFTGWPVAGLLVGAFVMALPQLFGSRRVVEAGIDRTEAIAGWAENLRDTFASGQGLHRTLIVTAAVSPPAIRSAIQQMAEELKGRERLDVVLYRLARTLADPTADLMVSSLILAEQGQADKIGELLSALARTAREEAAMQRRVQAGRARVHTAAAVVTGTLVVFFVGLVLLGRQFLSPYDSWTGQLVLGIVGLIFAVSLSTLNRMARRLVGERVLLSGPQPVPSLEGASL